MKVLSLWQRKSKARTYVSNVAKCLPPVNMIHKSTSNVCTIAIGSDICHVCYS